jgi:ribA/ribD-fused uncharacterized protein
MITKPYREETRTDWNDVRVPIMYWSIKVKAAQNPDFRLLLAHSGTKTIVEKSSKDAFWGAMYKDQFLLEGENTLGYLHMDLREDMRNGLFDNFNIIKPPQISNFMLFGQPIGNVSVLR